VAEGVKLPGLMVWYNTPHTSLNRSWKVYIEHSITCLSFALSFVILLTARWLLLSVTDGRARLGILLSSVRAGYRRLKLAAGNAKLRIVMQ
jgi:hypothetical protein